jgi:protein PhnA
MSEESQICPKCQSPYGYRDGTLWVCPECAHEWSADVVEEAPAVTAAPTLRDANGVELKDGDTVRVVKDLKVGSGTLKSGTKVKGIRLLDEPVNGHDISCRVEGFGSIYLKCSVVRKE